MADLGTVNLNRLRIFVTVIETGSLTAAAARLGLAKSMVSKHMQLLEAELGVSLLARSTRRLSLTDAGRRFHDSSRQLLAAAEQAITEARTGLEAPQGTLRVAAAIDYGVMVVAPLLARLRARYPALKVELVCGDSLVDLIAEGVDVAVRLGRLADSGHMAARVGSFARWLVASPDFIARHGRPGSLEQLAALPHIALTVLPQPYSFSLTHTDGTQRTVRMQNTVFATNTAYACRAAALAGDGVLMATGFLVGDDLAAGRLVKLLPEWTLARGDIHAIYPATRHQARKVRVFIDALRQAVGAD
ncbi:LysR substrate-binding domain-containing protein [Oxalobacteraceae bacterium A2-2]